MTPDPNSSLCSPILARKTSSASLSTGSLASGPDLLSPVSVSSLSHGAVHGGSMVLKVNLVIDFNYSLALVEPLL